MKAATFHHVAFLRSKSATDALRSPPPTPSTAQRTQTQGQTVMPWHCDAHGSHPWLCGAFRHRPLSEHLTSSSVEASQNPGSMMHINSVHHATHASGAPSPQNPVKRPNRSLCTHVRLRTSALLRRPHLTPRSHTSHAKDHTFMLSNPSLPGQVACM